MGGHEEITGALTEVAIQGTPALVPFITAGYPEPAEFLQTLGLVASVGDVVEVGVPFSDPMADGVTIQRSSRAAIASGVSLRWILEQLSGAADIQAPVVLMSYLNPLMALGLDRLPALASDSGVSGFIVPDLSLEESADFRAALEAEGLGLVQLVTPVTPERRLAELCQASRGFVYAVTVAGITGGGDELPAEVTVYLDRVREYTDLPVCAGFGVRGPAQVEMLSDHADGVIVGSALIEELEAGRDPVAFLRGLRAGQD